MINLSVKFHEYIPYGLGVMTLPLKYHRSTFDHHLNELGRIWIPMLYSKIQPQSFLGSKKKVFLSFLSYKCMVAIWMNGE